MSQNVSVKIQINDGGSFKDITVNVEELARAFNTVKAKANELEKSFVDMASISQIVDGLSSAVQNLHGYISNLTQDYKAAVEAETKLATAMRNTMDATDEEIQSIKDFCDEQERLGVVAGDVQVSAAQELATYLEFSDSLKTLIPVVNDMTVQQYGLGASAESATQIATMLGKVMNGQTKALSRYGYEFTEAQEAVLLYGNEAERAAMLAEVVGQSVGGMNYEMANTPVGVLQQAENRLGKMRESIGAFAIQIEPALRNLSLFTSTTADIVKVAQAIEAAKKSSVGMKVASLAAAAAQKTQAVAAKILGVAQYNAATATRALKLEVVALEAAITLGVSVAITGLITLIGKLRDKSSDAEAAIGEVDDATVEYGRAAGEVRGQIMLEIGALEDIIEKHKKEKDKVDELNGKYGESFGYHSTAAEWYDTLTTKSEAYCRQLGYEAKAKLLAAQYGEALVAQDELENTLREMEENGNRYAMKLRVRVVGGDMNDEDNPIQAEQFWQPVETEEYKAAVESLNQARSNAEGLQIQLNECVTAAKAASDAVGGIGGTKYPGGGSGKKTAVLDMSVVMEDISAMEALREEEAMWADQNGKAFDSFVTGIDNLYGKSKDDLLDLSTLLDGAADMLGLQDFLDTMQDTSTAMAKAPLDTDKFAGATDAISSLSMAFEGLNGIMSESAGSWASWISNMLRAVAQAIPAIKTLTAAHNKNTAAASGDAAASGAAAVAGIPAVGPGLAVAAAATIAASIMSVISSLPKFANGGIVYGPTLGIFGEYPGASNNPEVVAPLDRLEDIVGGRFTLPSAIEVRARGRDLYNIIKIEESIRKRG